MTYEPWTGWSAKCDGDDCTEVYPDDGEYAAYGSRDEVDYVMGTHGEEFWEPDGGWCHDGDGHHWCPRHCPHDVDRDRDGVAPYYPALAAVDGGAS